MGYNERNEMMGMVTLFGKRPCEMELTDFILRLDLIGVMASANAIFLKDMLKASWPQIMSSDTPDFYMIDNCMDYFASYRLGLKIMSKGEILQKEQMILRSLVIVAVLYYISDDEYEWLDTRRMKSSVISMLSENIIDNEALQRRVDEVIRFYFYRSSAINKQTRSLIKENINAITDVYDILINNLKRVNGTNNTKKITDNGNAGVSDIILTAADRTVDSMELGKQSHQVSTQNISAVAATRLLSYQPSIVADYSRYMCMLFLALAKSDQEGLSREEALEKSWYTVFKNNRFDIAVVDRYISDSKELDAVNMLFKYPLREIRSERLVRRFLTCMCANLAISKLPYTSSLSMIVNEALLIYSRFDVMSNGMEEEDLEQYIRRYAPNNENVDEQYSAIFWEFSDAFVHQCRKSVEEINSEDRVKSRTEKVNEQKNKQITDLREQITSTRVAAFTELIKSLTDSPYDYVLSRLYRYAYGYDNLSPENLRALIKNMLHVLHRFGVEATGTELIDRTVAEISSEDKKFVYKPIIGMEGNIIAFPGWTVSGDTVILPSSNFISEEESN